MDLTINVKIDASAKLLEAINGLSALVNTVAEKSPEVAPVKEAKTEKPAPAKKAESAKADTKEETKDTNISIESLREIVREKAVNGKKETIKGILKNMGATSVSNLEKSNYASFKEKVEAL